jgi:serine/threonine protein kinase
VAHRFPTEEPTQEVGYCGLCRVEGNPVLETLLAICPRGAQHELVIVKRVGARHREDHALVTRLLAEARAAMPLRHRNIVSILDVVLESMSIVTEYQPGDSLEVLLARGIPVPAVCTIAHDLAAALAHAHQHQGIAFSHRALSPSSILVADSGVAKLDDFGVMRVVISHPAAGELARKTLRYEAPESRREHPTGTPADLYALGAILHEALTGVRSFVGSRSASGSASAPRTAQHAPGAAPPPSATNPQVPWQLDRLVAELLDPDPRRRPTASQVMTRLEELPRASAEQLGQWLTAPPRRKARRRALEEKAIEQVRAQGFGAWTKLPPAATATRNRSKPRTQSEARPAPAQQQPAPAQQQPEQQQQQQPAPQQKKQPKPKQRTKTTQGTQPPARQVAVRPPRHLRVMPLKPTPARGSDPWWMLETEQRAPAQQSEQPSRQPSPWPPEQLPAHTPQPRWAQLPTETEPVLRTPAVAVQALPVSQPRFRGRAPRESVEQYAPAAPVVQVAPVAQVAQVVHAAQVAAAPSVLMASQESGLLMAPPTLARSPTHAAPRRWLSALTATVAIAIGSVALWPVLSERAVRSGGAALETLNRSLSRPIPAAKPATHPTFEPILPGDDLAARPAAPSPPSPPSPPRAGAAAAIPLAPSLATSRDATIAPSDRSEPPRAGPRRIKRPGKRKRLRSAKPPPSPSVRASPEARPQLPDL